MSQDTASSDSATRENVPVSLTDPETVRGREDIVFSTETQKHEEFDHCAVDIEERSVVGVENADGEFLLLVHDDLGLALLPHGVVESGDWAAVARQGVEGQTGIAVTLDGIEAVRDVEHVVEGSENAQTTSYRVLFRGSPVSGEIRECKQRTEAGSDGWRAGWFADLPEDSAPPQGGPADDLHHFLG